MLEVNLSQDKPFHDTVGTGAGVSSAPGSFARRIVSGCGIDYEVGHSYRQLCS